MPPKVDPKSQRSVFADLAKQIADHQARIQVIAANWEETITEHLNATEKKLLAAIAKELANFTFRPNAKETLVKLKRIHTILRKLRLKGWMEAQEAIEREARELAANEAKWAQKVAKVTSDPKDAAKLKDVSRATLDKVVKFGLADGKTVGEYFDQLADAEAVRLESTIRQGVESGWTIDQMTRNIAGTAQNEYTDGLLNVTKNAAKMMARTLTNAIANNAKDAFYQENADIIPQVEILATLDGRTCPACGGLDRTRYKTGEPHPSLPVHHNCRCVLLPVTILSDLVEESRPMARSDFMADAKRRYEAKYPGKKWEDLSESTRKKYYYKEMREYERTTGQSAYTQVSGGMSFKDYFQNEMTDQQRQDWLGPEKFNLWKKGNMPLDRFIPPYPDKAMTVREMKRLDQESFASMPTPDKAKAKALLDFFKGKKSETQPQELTPHQIKRKEQLERARRNRAEREAQKIGAKMIEGTHSIEDDLKATNPNYVAGRDGVWENNCQRCVVAYELRRRGIDVEAKPCLSDQTEEDLLKRKWEKFNGNAQWKFADIPDANERKNFVINKMKTWGEGSRGTVYVKWNDKEAHVFSAEVIDGKVVFVDPQNGNIDAEKYFSEQKVGFFGIARVDNLKINDYIKEVVEAKNEQRRSKK